MPNNTTNNGFIENGLRADIMRHSMENKNLLNTKGSIYVGTGRKTTITTSQGDYNVPITTSLPCGANNTVLTADSSEPTGLKYKKITKDMLDETSVEADVWPIKADSANTADQAAAAVTGQYASNDKTKGTIEQRLTALESQESFHYAAKDIFYTYGTRKSIGQVYTSGYKQGAFVYLTLTFTFYSATYPNAPMEFYADVRGLPLTATCNRIVLDNPASSYDFYFPSNYIEYYDSQGNYQKIHSVPLKCTLTTSGDLQISVYNIPDFQIGNGTNIRREINRQITICYPVSS